MILRFFRFATKAERLLLAYQAWGYSEDEVIQRWRADLASIPATHERDACFAASVAGWRTV